MHKTSPIPVTSAVSISDHDVVGLAYGNDDEFQKIIEPHYRISRHLIHALATNTSSNIYKRLEEAIDVSYFLYNKYKERGDHKAASRAWTKLKQLFKSICMKTDELHRKKAKRKRKKAIEITNFEDIHQGDVNKILERNKALNYLADQQRKDAQFMKAASIFNWIRDGENSNKLFFQTMKQREKINHIPMLRNPNGELANSPLQNKRIVSDSYAKTFEKRLPCPVALEKVKDAIKASGRRLSGQNKVSIVDSVSAITCSSDREWLTDTIEKLKMYKAPGADGIPNEIYFIFRNNINFIEILGETFKESIGNGEMPECMCTTYYKLLYKKGFYSKQELDAGTLDGTPKDPRNLSNWRPIALLPCDSKILSSFFADKLKSPGLVDRGSRVPSCVD